MSSLEIEFTYISPEEDPRELHSKLIIFPIKDKENNQNYVHFYCQYNQEYFENDLQTAFFMFERIDTLYLFFKKVFDNINTNYDILNVSNTLKSYNKIIFTNFFIHDLSYKTILNNFEDNLKIVKDFSISKNTKIFKEILIKNTENFITEKLPPELVDMICKLI
jgi:hypothetical protein